MIRESAGKSMWAVRVLDGCGADGLSGLFAPCLFLILSSGLGTLAVPVYMRFVVLTCIPGTCLHHTCVGRIFFTLCILYVWYVAHITIRGQFLARSDSQNPLDAEMDGEL